jgi:DNA repair photolyase
MRGVEAIEQTAKSVLNAVKGMPFAWSLNPYRGCYHQCRFCYARRSHSFLEEDGIAQWGSRIFVKINAPAVLRTELAKRSWRHESVAIGTVTDPYQPLEGRYKLMRGILAALHDYDTPAGITTRSPLVVRDIDLLQQLARGPGAHVSISIATLDEALARDIEPTVAAPRQRLRAVRVLADAGIPVNVALAPVLPRITDSVENLEAVVRAARDAGAAHVWHNALYLQEITRESFFAYLRERKPELLAEYATLYKGTYAPREIAAQIESRVKTALAAYPPQSFRRIKPRPQAQLELLAL